MIHHLYILGELTAVDLIPLGKEASVIAVLGWLVWYFQKKLEILGRQHEELHNSTLHIIAQNTAALATMTLQLKNNSRDIKLMLALSRGNREDIVKILNDSNEVRKAAK